MDLPSRAWESHLRALLDRVGLGQGGRLLVALSGGPDSLCLAHLLWEMREPLKLDLLAAHLDHGIRPSSADEASDVMRLCDAWGLACITGRRDVPALAGRSGISLELAARTARYTYLAEVARSRGCGAIATAHHADDQVETVLWRLLRGAGAGGLRGIRAVAPLDPAFDEARERGEDPLLLVRPLLPVTRAPIEAYCRRRGLEPIWDASNADETIPRNWLRHTVVPMLRSRAPHLAISIGRATEVLSAEDDLLDQMAAEAWQACDGETAEGTARLRREPLRRQHPALMRRLLRRAYELAAGSMRDLGWQHVHGLEQMVAHGTVGATLSLPGAMRAELGHDWLVMGRGDSFRPSWRPRLDSQEVMELPWPGSWRPPGSDWRLEMRLMAWHELPADWRDARHPYVAYLDVDVLPPTFVMRTRRPGDRIQPLGIQGSQSLQDLMVDRRVPRRERDRLPVLLADDRILWVVGCRLAADAAITSGTNRVLELRVVADDEEADA